MFGNTTAFLLSSMHVVFRLLRLPLGIGFILFVFISLLVISGFVSKFNLLRPFRSVVKDLPHINRAFHVSLVFSFYLLFSFHLLNVLGRR
jgi:SNF family Na+-dependent transporter